MAPLLSIRDLRVTFATDAGVARAVDAVSLDIDAGETVGIVGESGCGKTVTGLSILRLIRPPGRIETGSTIEFEGQDLMRVDERALRAIRGNRIAMVFQEPTTALNPVYSVGAQIAEVVQVHEGASRGDAWVRAVDALAQVGVPSPDERARQYPHQLSGGTRQRVMMAMGLVLHPLLLIADEPTSSLDVTVQAQLLTLLVELQRRLGMAMLLIAHDLGVVAEIAQRVVVMYAGEVVEDAPVDQIFAAPQHPYTAGLLRAMPRIDDARRGAPLVPIAGVVPPATAWPSGCRFHDRCAFAWRRCIDEAPPLYTVGPSHSVRCHLAVEPARRHSPTPTGARIPAAASSASRVDLPVTIPTVGP